MLIGGETSGAVPLTVQYSGRHISPSKGKLLKHEFDAGATTEKIQFGAVLGAIAQVIVPDLPLSVAAFGTDPIPPGTVTVPGVVVVLPPDEVLWLLLLQAPSAVTDATARTSPPTVLLRNLIIGPPPSRSSRLKSVLGSSACRPSFSQLRPAIRSAPGAGSGVAGPYPVTARIPGTSAPARDEPAGQLPVL